MRLWYCYKSSSRSAWPYSVWTSSSFFDSGSIGLGRRISVQHSLLLHVSNAANLETEKSWLATASMQSWVKVLTGIGCAVRPAGSNLQLKPTQYASAPPRRTPFSSQACICTMQTAPVPTHIAATATTSQQRAPTVPSWRRRSHTASPAASPATASLTSKASVRAMTPLSASSSSSSPASAAGSASPAHKEMTRRPVGAQGSLFRAAWQCPAERSRASSDHSFYCTLRWLEMANPCTANDDISASLTEPRTIRQIAAAVRTQRRKAVSPQLRRARTRVHCPQEHPPRRLQIS